VARLVRADARVLYTDNDPGVIAHGREILAGVPGTAVIQADFRQPDELLDHAELRRLINLGEPAGLLIVALTQFIADADDPWRLVERYLGALAPGSYLALSAPTADHTLARKNDRIIDVYATSTIPTTTPRSKSEVRRFFSGLEIMPPYAGADPDLTSAGLWDCEDPDAAESDGSRMFYVAVARKPGPGAAKPAFTALGVEAGTLTWRRSSKGPGAIEVAFAYGQDDQWVLFRLADDPDGRVSVFSRFEWDCFLDGIKNGEFDDAGT
jgi:hypothetical protein